MPKRHLWQESGKQKTGGLFDIQLFTGGQKSINLC